MSKKTIVILIIVVVLVALVVGVYLGMRESQNYFAPGTEPRVTPNVPVGTPIVQLSIEGDYLSDEGLKATIDSQKNRLSIISRVPAVGYWVYQPNATTSIPFYISAQTGDIIKIVGDSEEKFSSVVGVPESVIVSPLGNKVLARSQTGAAVFDSASGSWEQLSVGIDSAAFSPDGKQLAYISGTAKGFDVYTRSFGAKPVTVRIASLALRDMTLAWPTSSALVLIPRPDQSITSAAWYFDLKNKTLNPLLSGKGLEMVFEPNKLAGLSFVANDKSVEGAPFSAQGGRGSLLVFSTVADKCIFASSTQAFCAVPFAHNKEFELNLFEDYMKRAAYFNDRIYGITWASSTVALRAVVDIPGALIDAVDLRAVGSDLYFFNRLDENVYRLTDAYGSY